jgi:NTE family protein
MKALVLSGGGANGAYEVGAIKYLFTVLGVQPDILCGTSVGAINNSFLAQFKKGNEIQSAVQLTNLWNSINTDTVYKKWYNGLLWYLPVLWKESVYNTEPIREFIRQNLDPKRVATSGKKLRVVAVSWTTGEAQTWSEDDEDIAEGVLASSCFPIFFWPIKIKGVPWVDGGLRNITPLRTAIELGATEIYVVTCQPPKISFTAKPKLKVLDQVPRALSIMTNEIHRDDIKKTELINQLCKAGKAPQGKKEIVIKLVQARSSLGDSLDFSPDKNRALMDLGFTDAADQLG